MNSNLKKTIPSILTAAIIVTASLTGTAEHSRTAGHPSYPLPTGSFPSIAEQTIDSLIDAGIRAQIFPGAVVVVVKEDTLKFIKPYGNREIVPVVLPMTDTTVFDLASLSKCISTTIAAMQLIEKGKLSLNDKVKSYIPEFSPWMNGSEKVDITVRQLLSHSSGLASSIPVKKIDSLAGAFGGANPDSLMHYIATKSKRHFRPGSKCLYSCLNFITLQNIIEKVSGERLDEYARRNIFEPLGMFHTGYLPLGNKIPQDADIAATEVLADGTPLVGAVHDPTARVLNGGVSGNAGVFSNGYDLAVFCSAIMDGGEISGHHILDSATVKLMCTIPREDNQCVGRTLGWDCKTKAAAKITDEYTFSHRHICHTGYTGTSIVMDLDRHIAVILLTNRVHPADKGSLSSTRRKLCEIVSQYSI